MLPMLFVLLLSNVSKFAKLSNFDASTIVFDISDHLDLAMHNSKNEMIQSPDPDIFSLPLEPSFANQLIKHSYAIIRPPHPLSSLPFDAELHIFSKPSSSQTTPTHPERQFFEDPDNGNKFLDCRFTSSPQRTDPFSLSVQSTANYLSAVGRACCEVSNIDLRLVDFVPSSSSSSSSPSEVSNTVQRIARYPPNSKSNSSQNITFGAHTDTTFFTIVPACEIAGLQIFDPFSLCWVTPESFPQVNLGDLVVVPGELLQVITNNIFRAGAHRVFSSSTKTRISTPFLLRHASNVKMEEVWKALQFGNKPLKRPPSPSSSPRIELFNDLLSSSECQSLIDSISDRLAPGTIFGADSEQKKSDDTIRTSTTCWLGHNETTITRKIANIAAKISGLPVTFMEKLHASRYEVDQEYKLHVDSVPEFVDYPCGPRVSTMIFYLNEDFDGGTTHFPRVNFTVIPKTGSAVHFHNVNAKNNSIVDYDSAHKGGKVSSGVKYIITIWIHAISLD